MKPWSVVTLKTKDPWGILCYIWLAEVQVWKFPSEHFTICANWKSDLEKVGGVYFLEAGDDRMPGNRVSVA